LYPFRLLLRLWGDRKEVEAMKKNMGTIDRLLRFFVIGPLSLWGALAAGPLVLAVVLYAVAGIMVLTALVGFCPLYALLGIDTRPRQVRLGA
jgi:hypothetical protein